MGKALTRIALIVANGIQADRTGCSTRSFDHCLRQQQMFQRLFHGVFSGVGTSIRLPALGDELVHRFVQFARVVSEGSDVFFDLHLLKLNHGHELPSLKSTACDTTNSSRWDSTGVTQGRHGSSNERIGALGFSFRSRRKRSSRCWQTQASISSHFGVRTPFASGLEARFDFTRNCHFSKSFT